MTSGTRITDLRSTVTGDCGTGLSGFYAVKTWNGGDQPPRPARSTKIVFQYLYRNDPYIGKDGSRRVRRRKLGVREKIVITDKPKRRFTYGEHAYSMSYDRTLDCPLIYRKVVNGPIWSGHSNLCGYGLASVGPWSWNANDDIVLINKLRNKLVGDSFNIGVFLAELPKAAEMIANAAIRIGKALHYAKHGSWWLAEEALVGGYISRGGLSRRKAAANNWLELQYGWRPLIDDAYAGAQMLAHMANEPFQQVVRVSRQITSTAPALSSSPALSDFVRNSKLERKTIKAIISEVDVARLTGLTDPASIAWELVPYSFVADWFIPVGNFLSARGVAQSVTGTFVTSFKRSVEVREIKSVSSSRFFEKNGYSATRILFNRSIDSRLSVPLPAFKPLNKVASWLHVTNAVALLSRFKSS